MGSDAPLPVNLGAGIQQHVLCWKTSVMELTIAQCKRMSTFVILSQENVQLIVFVSYLSLNVLDGSLRSHDTIIGLHSIHMHCKLL